MLTQERVEGTAIRIEAGLVTNERVVVGQVGNTRARSHERVVLSDDARITGVLANEGVGHSAHIAVAGDLSDERVGTTGGVAEAGVMAHERVHRPARVRLSRRTPNEGVPRSGQVVHAGLSTDQG